MSRGSAAVAADQGAAVAARRQQGGVAAEGLKRGRCGVNPG
jgi:hypothetical protein